MNEEVKDLEYFDCSIWTGSYCGYCWVCQECEK